ncbi:hypothetical protein FVEG_14592 [Fusarium verticillioides 7600]|uniref:Uncharacterized protein n=1 Tax=Gibberella moniliformis (strain M3125 / FGSC 7600) TaxID=334819 RepID=W7LTQ7_GIBM7|nr:hypothetical protein FVEG_14592 [Fusarium verticillioides 7600]EWG35952.1 hypothetical protein FVEG_14592 [Fusarium verticillioides 7600]
MITIFKSRIKNCFHFMAKRSEIALSEAEHHSPSAGLVSQMCYLHLWHVAGAHMTTDGLDEA